MPHFGITANKKLSYSQRAGVHLPSFAFSFLKIRLKTYGFLHKTNFCLFFPFSPSDVWKYASRAKNEKFCSKSAYFLTKNKTMPYFGITANKKLSYSQRAGVHLPSFAFSF